MNSLSAHVTRLLMVFLLLLMGVISINGCAESQLDIKDTAAYAEKTSLLWETSGIRVVRIAPTAGGQMLDLRYRITDVEQAVRILKKNTLISLLDQTSRRVLPVPDLAQVGKLRSIPNKEDKGRIFWVFFDNSDGVVKSGSKVTLIIGDVSIKDIIVE